MVKLTNTELEKVASFTAFLPPDLLLMLCDTDDRRNHFCHVRVIMQELAKGLEHYFHGRKYHYNFGNKNHNKLYENYQQMFIHLYDLIYHLWDELKIKFKMKHPYQLLNLILEKFAISRFLFIFPETYTGNYYYEVNYHKIHKDAKELQKLKQLETLTLPQEKRLKQLLKQKNEKQQGGGLTELNNIILSIRAIQVYG